jgi:ribosomal protein S18 acetylase RimI-like enzyme
MRTKPTKDGGHRYPPPLILPIEKEDAYPMSIFAYEAVAPSPLQAYFNPTPSDRAHAVKSLECMFLESLSDPTLTLMKAVDPETEEVASYAIWEHVLCFGSGQAKEAEGRIEQKWKAAGLKLHLMSLSSGYEDKEKRDLKAFIGAETTRFMDSWAKDMNYIELQALGTAPRFQRRGYASALVKWGYERADAESRVSFLLGSPNARSLYVSLGWKEVGQIVADMREWAENAEGGDLGWGIWKAYHMIRLPRAVS